MRARQAPVAVEDEERRDPVLPHGLQGGRGELLGADRARDPAGSSRRPSPELTRVVLEQAPEVAVRDDAEEAVRAVDDGRDPHHLAGHLVDRGRHRRVGRDPRNPVARAHQVPHLQEPAAEAAPRVERGEVLLPEAPPLRDRQGEGVTHGEHGRRRGGRSQIQGQASRGNRDGDRDLGRPPRGGCRIARHRDRPDSPGPRELQQPNDLGRLSRDGEREDDVARHEHAEVAVARLSGVQKVSGSPGGGQGGGDLLADQPGLSETGHAEPSGRGLNRFDRLQERRPEIVDLPANGVRFDLQDLPGRIEGHARILPGRPGGTVDGGPV